MHRLGPKGRSKGSLKQQHGAGTPSGRCSAAAATASAWHSGSVSAAAVQPLGLHFRCCSTGEIHQNVAEAGRGCGIGRLGPESAPFTQALYLEDEAPTLLLVWINTWSSCAAGAHRKHRLHGAGSLGPPWGGQEPAAECAMQLGRPCSGTIPLWPT